MDLNLFNKLIDIQTTIGAEETKKIILLLNTFSNFMIAIVSLVFILSGSIIYSKIKENRGAKKVAPKKKPLKKAPTKKKKTIKK